jgi:LPXTG-motif cell wall-anchored protein
MSSNTTALFGFGGLAVGAILGIVGTVLVKRKKKTPAAA